MQGIDGDIILQPCNNHPDLLVPQSFVKLTNKQTHIKLCNPTHKFIMLKKGCNFWYLEEVDRICGEESTGDGESGCYIRQCNLNMESALVEDVESPLEATPEKDTNNLVNEESTSVSPIPTLGEVVKLIPVHVQDLFTRSMVNLNEEQSIELTQFLTEFADIFAKSDTDLGYFSAIQHRINTRESKPIHQHMHQTLLGFVEEEEKHLKKMLDSGVIQPSYSEWSLP